MQKRLRRRKRSEELWSRFENFSSEQKGFSSKRKQEKERNWQIRQGEMKARQQNHRLDKEMRSARYGSLTQQIVESISSVTKKSETKGRRIVAKFPISSLENQNAQITSASRYKLDIRRAKSQTLPSALLMYEPPQLEQLPAFPSAPPEYGPQLAGPNWANDLPEPPATPPRSARKESRRKQRMKVKESN